MLKWLFSLWLLPLFGSFFAAGPAALSGADDGAASDGGVDDGAAADDGAADDGAVDDGAVDDGAGLDDDQPAVTQRDDRPAEDPELAEFKGTVAARLRKLEQRSPDIAQAFKKDPKLKEEVAAIFRREAALREVFPTVAEARQFRERFPNGLADVQALEADVAEVEQLDKDFYTRDQDGKYPGHQRLLSNMFQDDRGAAVSLFKTMPKEWARLDPDSYNEVMGQIVGATIARAGVLDHIGALIDDAKEAKQDGLAKNLNKLLNWAEGFLKAKPQPTPEQEQLTRDRQALDRQKADRDKEDGQRFNSSFVAESRKLQVGIIKAHPAVKRVLDNKAISESKKNEIIEQIRRNAEKFLGNSRSFMRQLKPAHASRELQKTIDIQKAAWSQQWFLNRMVRTVLAKEVPQMVQNNRDAVRRRAGAPPVKTNNNRPPAASDKKPTGPYQIGGKWYKADGQPFTTAEILAGKHQK